MELINAHKCGLVIWGTKDGKYLFSKYNIGENTKELNVQFSDLDNLISWNDSRNYNIYHINFVNDKIIYTVFHGAKDIFGRQGYYALSLILPEKATFKEVSFLDTLNKLSVCYKENYIDFGKVEFDNLHKIVENIDLIGFKNKNQTKDLTGFISIDFKEIDLIEKIFKYTDSNVKELFIIPINGSNISFRKEHFKKYEVETIIDEPRQEKLKIYNSKASNINFDINIFDYKNENIKNLISIGFSLTGTIDIAGLEVDDVVKISSARKDVKIISQSVFKISDCELVNGIRNYELKFEIIKPKEFVSVKFLLSEETKDESIIITNKKHFREVIGKGKKISKIDNIDLEETLFIEYEETDKFQKFSDSKVVKNQKESNGEYLIKIELTKINKAKVNKTAKNEKINQPVPINKNSKLYRNLKKIGFFIGFLLFIYFVIKLSANILLVESKEKTLDLTLLKTEILEISKPNWQFNTDEEIKINKLYDSLCNGNQGDDCKEYESKLNAAIENAKFRAAVDSIYGIDDINDIVKLNTLLQRMEGDKKKFLKAYEDDVQFNKIKQKIEISISETKDKKPGPDRPKTRNNENNIRLYVTACNNYKVRLINKDNIPSDYDKFWKDHWCGSSSILYSKNFYRDNLKNLTENEKKIWQDLEAAIPYDKRFDENKLKKYEAIK
jgi:hypothetical protein